MRHLTVAGVWSAVLTFGAAAALRADNAVLAVLAMATLAALFGWMSAQFGDEERSGLALTSPFAALTLTMSGRHPRTELLPVIAAQIVGAVLGGIGAWSLSEQLGLVLGWTTPSAIGAAITSVFIGVIAGWLTAFIDSYLNDGLMALPVLFSAGVLPVGYAFAVNPAVIFGLATAGLLTWITAIAVIVGVLLGAVLSALTLRYVVAPPN